MKLTKLFTEFSQSEKSASILLIFCTGISLVLANTLGYAYTDIWHTYFLGISLEHWINDGLMAVFFLLIGLEIEREIYAGELKNFRNALLPICAAVGGAVLPAVIYAFVNYGTDTFSGIGVPMATDIAFALGILILLGSRVPSSLKIFLTALAIIDDLIAIVIIAIFYTETIHLGYLAGALGICGALFVLNRRKVYSLLPYVVGGILMWYLMLNSGIHATIAGVLLAFVIPFSDTRKKCISYRLQHSLHKVIAFFILPLFALANTGIIFGSDVSEIFFVPYGMGIFLGLLIGKPLGIILTSLIATKLGWCSLPFGVRFRHIVGVGFLAGIGFTMSIFVTLLAFDSPEVINSAKLVIILTSTLSAILGYTILRSSLK